MKIPLLLLLLNTVLSFGQSPLRETLAMAGGTSIVSNGNAQYLLQESIGQHSVIFTFNSNDNILRQGYVQPLSPSGAQGNPSGLDVIVYPNPIVETVKIQIRENIGENVLVSLFDFQGKWIKSKEYTNTTNFEMSLDFVSNGVYFLKVTSDQKSNVLKVIKQ